MRAVVTGGAGFIGSHLIEALVTRGDEVVCIERPGASRRWLDGLDLSYRDSGLDDVGALTAAFAGADVVFHLAGLTEARAPHDFYAVNTEGTARVFRAAAAHDGRAPRVILMSSLAALGPCRNGDRLSPDTVPYPISHYGHSKLLAEAIAHAFADRVPATIIRPTSVYGPRERGVLKLFRLVRRGVALTVGSWDREVSLVHVADLVRALLAAADAEQAIHRTYCVAYPEPVTWREFARAVGRALERQPLLLRRAPATLSPPLRTLRELYPVIWLAGFWPELGLLQQLRIPPTFDQQIAALDLALFGIHGSHVNLVWMQRMPYVWLSEPMHFAYWAYYLLIGLPPLALMLLGRTAALRDLVFRLMLTYLTCYAIYLVYPVYGPGLTLPRYAGPLTDGLFHRLVASALDAGDSPGSAFPSSHVAGAVTIAYACSRWLPRRIATLLWLEAIGVLVSTVYTQNHFPVDALAGCAGAWLLQIAVAGRVARWLGDCSTVPGPVLPVFALTPVAASAGSDR